MTNPYHVFAAWEKYRKGLSLADKKTARKLRKKQKKKIHIKKKRKKAKTVIDYGYPCQCDDCKAWRYGKRKHGCKRSKPKECWHKKARWRKLRQKALDYYGSVCHCCGAAGEGVEIHVDHIKPRSKYPELSFEFENLQILCRVCNFSKNNRHETDYRRARVIEGELENARRDIKTN